MTKALTKLEATIEAQQKKLAQLKAQKQKIEALHKARLTGLARKQDTRRKVLAGALSPRADGQGRRVSEKDAGHAVDVLTRPDDRALFCLRSAGE